MYGRSATLHFRWGVQQRQDYAPRLGDTKTETEVIGRQLPMGLDNRVFEREVQPPQRSYLMTDGKMDGELFREVFISRFHE